LRSQGLSVLAIGKELRLPTSSVFKALKLAKGRISGVMVWGVVIVYARGLESIALVEYAARRGWTDVYATSNPGELMRTIRSGRVAAVLCSGLSGLARVSLSSPV
jgi:hypothetical protein